MVMPPNHPAQHRDASPPGAGRPFVRAVPAPPSRSAAASWFVIGLCTLLVGCGPHDAQSARELSQCYRQEFEAEPPNGVFVLSARQMSVRDWGAQWLKIQAETNAIDAILLKKFKRQTSPPEQLASAKSKHTPDWWILPPPSQLEFYTCQNWTRGTWHSSRAVIAVHRADGIVFFYCERTD